MDHQRTMHREGKLRIKDVDKQRFNHFIWLLFESHESQLADIRIFFFSGLLVNQIQDTQKS